MKKWTSEVVLVVFVAATLICSVAMAANGNLPGSGTATDPYLIEDLVDFDVFADPANAQKYWTEGAHLKLVSDIDLSGRTYASAVINVNIPLEIYGFQGVFDGNGHVVRNLAIFGMYNPSNLGLFNTLDAGLLKNLGVVNVDIEGGGSLGALAGTNNRGTVFNCYATGVVKGHHDYIGGLVGQNYFGGICDCYADVSVSGESGSFGSEGVGGLVGMNKFASILNCYSTGSVKNASWLGGLVGYNYHGSVQASFWNIDTSGRTWSDGGTGLNTEQMQTLSNFTDAGWDFSDADGNPSIWRMAEHDYPRLLWETVPFPSAGSPDISGDGKVDIADFARLALNWLNSACAAPDWCNDADIDRSGDVTLADLSALVGDWMEGVYIEPDYLDDFDDNAMASMWTLMASDTSKCWLDETNQRLEVRATSSSDGDVALYVPNGWHLDTTQDFGFKIRYHNEVQSVAWSELLFALGDPSDVQEDHLQFSVCSYTDDGYSGLLFMYDYVQDGSTVEDFYLHRESTEGWIFVSYNAAADEVYFGIEGYGSQNAVAEVSGLLRGTWAGKEIAPHIGGSSDHIEMNSGQAYWDDLIMDYGETIQE